MSKDWTGNKKSVYTTLGASNHSNCERQTEDYYATDPKAVELLCELEKFSNNIWEPACGEGHISKVLEEHGYNVKSTDLIDRGFGDVLDFLKTDNSNNFNGDIVTNPPYKYALEFLETALQRIPSGNKVAMFLKLTFLEGKKRAEFFKNNPPKIVYVASSRFECGMNGVFSGGSATAYAWFIFEKGYNGDPIIKWFN